MSRVLFLSYDGALDPLGASQIVPYVEGLAAEGYAMTLLTFEKPARWREEARRRAMADRLRSAGVEWMPLRYRKRPPVLGTLWNLLHGELELRRRFGPGHFDLLHARSYPSALLASRLKSRFGARLLFDIRGFYAEERTEGGIWREGGILYRRTKTLERRFLRASDAVVTLTRASVPTLERWITEAGGRAPVQVIPTSVDLDRFSPEPAPDERARDSDGAAQDSGKQAGDPVRFVYFGSIGTWYMLPEMVELAGVVLERIENAEVHFYVNTEEERVRDAVRGLDPDRVLVKSLPPEAVPAALTRARVGFHLIRPTFSKTASAATKVGEALASGLPVLTNPGVGDVAEQLRDGKVGALVESFDRKGYVRAVERVMELLAEPGIRARCRRFAEEHLALEDAVRKYRDIYRSIFGTDAAG